MSDVRNFTVNVSVEGRDVKVAATQGPGGRAFTRSYGISEDDDINTVQATVSDEGVLVVSVDKLVSTASLLGGRGCLDEGQDDVTNSCSLARK